MQDHMFTGTTLSMTGSSPQDAFTGIKTKNYLSHSQDLFVFCIFRKLS